MSSSSSGSQSHQQTKTLPQHHSYPDCPLLASERVVSGLGECIHRASQTSPLPSGSVASTSLSPLPPRAPRASTDRMETIQRFLKHAGFSSKVSRFLALDKRPSTQSNYQHKWKRFRDWCKAQGHTSSNPSIQKIADFLVYLRQDCGLSSSSIKGYKAMLSGVFSLRGLDIAGDQVLRSVIRACSSQPARPPRSLTPPWNLDVVLRFLTQAPFEPLQQSSIRDLTRKTLFLLALATAQRVSELQALSYKTSLQGDDLVISFLPEFIAKTDTESYQSPRDFRVRCLSNLVGPEEDERLLCPVRAVRHYLHRTCSPSRPRHLFLSVKRPAQAMSKAALSFFLRDTIRSAHHSFPDAAGPVLRVRAHDIRGMATSLLLWRNCSIPEILRAARWKTRSVFADHYLREIMRREEDVFSLGPIVAADHIVS